MILGLTCLAGCHSPQAGVKQPVPVAAPNASQALKAPEKIPAPTPVAASAPKLTARQPADKIQIKITHKLQADLDNDAGIETAVAGYYDYGFERLGFLKIIKRDPLNKKNKVIFTLDLRSTYPVSGMQLWRHPQAGKLLLIKHTGGKRGFLQCTILKFNSGSGKFSKIPILDHNSKPLNLAKGSCAIKGAALRCSADDTGYNDKFSFAATCLSPRVEYLFRYNPRRQAFLPVKTSYELPPAKTPAAYLQALSLIKQADMMGRDTGAKAKARTLYLQAIAKLERLQQTQAKPAFKKAADYSRRQIKALSL